MIRFLGKLLLFSFVLSATYLLLVHKLSQGYVDMYYPKFTQPGGSLVLGLSRADQGIDPSLLQEELRPADFAAPFVNFASNQSYYGEVYLKAIRKKVPANVKNGLFILSVTPGSFTAPKKAGDRELVKMDEHTIMGKTGNFTTQPNYDYIMNCYGQALYNSLHTLTAWENLTTHEDGWNEVRMQSGEQEITKKDIAFWKAQNLSFYNRKIRTEAVRDHRKEYLEKTIEYLKGHGTVLLVRLPADPDIIELENQTWNGFDGHMDRIAGLHGIPYLNYSKGFDGMETYDGSHLASESAREFTRMLAADIREIVTDQQLATKTP